MQLSRTLPPLLALSGTLLGAPLSASLHDAAASLGGPRALPGAVVRAADPAAAREAALAAGAAEVWMALPDGDPRLAGASPDPGTLAPGPDGRLRFDGAHRLPLPEGLDGVLRLDVEQLGPGTPASLLAGRAVVVVWSDPAVGLREASPGRAAPVDRGEILAVALAAARADAHLRVLPLGVAAALAGAAALGWQRVLARRSAWRAVGATAAAAVLAVLLGVGARRLGLDLPWLGLVAAAGTALGGRILAIHRDALSALNRIELQLHGTALGGSRIRKARGAGKGAAAAPSPARDPRVRQAEMAAERTLARAERWERLIEQSGLPLGVFGPDGGLTYASPALTETVPRSTTLADVVATLTGSDATGVMARIAEAAAEDEPVCVPTRVPGRDLLVCPVGRASTRAGMLLQIVPASSRAADDRIRCDTLVLAADAGAADLGPDDPTTESAEVPRDRAPVHRFPAADEGAGAPASS